MVRPAWAGWWLGLVLGTGPSVAAQVDVPPPLAEVEENYPNPFFPATTIPFQILPAACAGGHQPAVSLKMYNVLVQVVAVPVLVGGSGERLDSLRLGCGAHEAYWDGKYLDGRGEVSPGVYYFQLTVDGERYTRKMIGRRQMTSHQ